MKHLVEALSKSMIKKIEKHTEYYIGMPYVITDSGPHYIDTMNHVLVEILDEEEKDEAFRKHYRGIIYKILFKYKDYNDLRNKIERNVDLHDEEKSKIELIYNLL